MRQEPKNFHFLARARDLNGERASIQNFKSRFGHYAPGKINSARLRDLS